MKVIVTQPTADALSYARALVKRGFEMVVPQDQYHVLVSMDEPVVMTRPVVPYVTSAIPRMFDVEGLGIENLGLLASGDRDVIPPAIGVAVERWLNKAIVRDVAVDVIGHGLGTVIALWLSRQGWTVTHWKHSAFRATPNRPIVNASRTIIGNWFDPMDCRVLDLPSNPREFSQDLIDIVMGRAEELCGK